MAIHKRISVLLVHASDTQNISALPTADFYRDMFLRDAMSLQAFWSEASDGAIDFSGTKVYDWRPHALTAANFNAIAARETRLRTAIEAFTLAGDEALATEISSSDIIVAIIAEAQSDMGAVGTSVLADTSASHGFCAHELGHCLGLDHSFDAAPTSHSPGADNRPGVYGDSFDIMSWALVNSFLTPRFGAAGPTLNTAMREVSGWLKPERTLSRDDAVEGHLRLYDIYNPTQPYVLIVDEFFIELRGTRSWDRGRIQPVLQVRMIDDLGGLRHSKLVAVGMNGGVAQYDIQVGASFMVGSPDRTSKSRYLRVTFKSFDPHDFSANLEIEYRPIQLRPDWTDPNHFLSNRTSDGGGWITTPEGTTIPVPPVHPYNDLLRGIAIGSAVQSLENLAMRREMQEAVSGAMRKLFLPG